MSGLLWMKLSLLKYLEQAMTITIAMTKLTKLRIDFNKGLQMTLKRLGVLKHMSPGVKISAVEVVIAIVIVIAIDARSQIKFTKNHIKLPDSL
jgi:hypothetical protein